MQWGLAKEDGAGPEKIVKSSEYQVGHYLMNMGLHTISNVQHLDSMPDFITNLEYFGTRVVEIKCPVKHRDVRPHNETEPGFLFCSQ